MPSFGKKASSSFFILVPLVLAMNTGHFLSKQFRKWSKKYYCFTPGVTACRSICRNDFTNDFRKNLIKNLTIFIKRAKRSFRTVRRLFVRKKTDNKKIVKYVENFDDQQNDQSTHQVRLYIYREKLEVRSAIVQTSP